MPGREPLINTVYTRGLRLNLRPEEVHIVDFDGPAASPWRCSIAAVLAE